VSENQYNPNDPAFLMSRSIDEPLDEQEKQRLADAINHAVDLREELEAFRGVDRVVKQWGGKHVAVGADRFVNNVLTRLADETDQADDEVDRILTQWGQYAPEVNEQLFVEAVLTRAKAKRLGLGLRPLVFRIGLPLAAAAAIALAVTAGLWFDRDFALNAPVSKVHYAALDSATDVEVTMGAAPRASRVVVFDRTAVASVSRTDNGRGVSFIVVGSSPIDSDMADLPPL
jgi:hypothetical protein